MIQNRKIDINCALIGALITGRKMSASTSNERAWREEQFYHKTICEQCTYDPKSVLENCFFCHFGVSRSCSLCTLGNMNKWGWQIVAAKFQVPEGCLTLGVISQSHFSPDHLFKLKLHYRISAEKRRGQLNIDSLWILNRKFKLKLNITIESLWPGASRGPVNLPTCQPGGSYVDFAL